MRAIIYAFAVGCFVVWGALTEFQARQERTRTTQLAREKLASLMIAAYPESLIKRNVVLVQASGHGQFYVKGDVFGSIQTFLVDTGAADVALRYEVAAAGGLRWEDGKPSCYESANGEVCGRTFIVPSLTIAGITKSSIVVAMLPKGALYSNLLGMSFLKKLSRVEFSTKTLRLEE